MDAETSPDVTGSSSDQLHDPQGALPAWLQGQHIQSGEVTTSEVAFALHQDKQQQQKQHQPDANTVSSLSSPPLSIQHATHLSAKQEGTLQAAPDRRSSKEPAPNSQATESGHALTQFLSAVDVVGDAWYEACGVLHPDQEWPQLRLREAALLLLALSDNDFQDDELVDGLHLCLLEQFKMEFDDKLGSPTFRDMVCHDALGLLALPWPWKTNPQLPLVSSGGSTRGGLYNHA